MMFKKLFSPRHTLRDICIRLEQGLTNGNIILSAKSKDFDNFTLRVKEILHLLEVINNPPNEGRIDKVSELGKKFMDFVRDFNPDRTKEAVKLAIQIEKIHIEDKPDPKQVNVIIKELQGLVDNIIRVTQ